VRQALELEVLPEVAVLLRSSKLQPPGTPLGGFFWFPGAAGLIIHKKVDEVVFPSGAMAERTLTTAALHAGLKRQRFFMTFAHTDEEQAEMSKPFTSPTATT
jgi:hypothetical protein